MPEPERAAQAQSSAPGPAMECFVVFPDVRHCPNINAWFGLARPVVERAGYGWRTLTAEIRSSEDYLTKLDEMMGDCALGSASCEDWTSR